MNASDLPELGKLAYGERWVSPLAADMNVTGGYIYSVLRGDNPFSYRLQVRLATALSTRASVLRDKAHALDVASASLPKGGQ